jgi:hypothetical protein
VLQLHHLSFSFCHTFCYSIFIPFSHLPWHCCMLLVEELSYMKWSEWWWFLHMVTFIREYWNCTARQLCQSSSTVVQKYNSSL